MIAWPGTLVVIGLAFAGTGCTPIVPDEIRDGQWIWSAADTVPLRTARQIGRVTAGVWVATVSADSGPELRGRLALDPALGGPDSVAAVIRFEPSLHPWWARVDDAQATAAFRQRIAAVLAVLDRSDTPVAEIQLDYDCPNRLLRRYAAVLRELTRSTLAGRRVWVTSLVTHLRDPEYSDALRGVVAGHILQLFDTGDSASAESLAEIVQRLERARVPFRIGLGAFERRRSDGPTDHRVWFRALPTLRRAEGYRGRWVFPAGISYDRLIERDR